VVRGSADGGPVERAKVEEPTATARIANGDLAPPAFDVTPDGTVFVAWGGTVWKWTDRLERWTEHGDVILDVRVVRDHLIAMLLGNRIQLVEIATGKLDPPLTHGGDVVFGSALDTVALEIGGYYHFLDPTTRVLWRTPIPRASMPPDLSSQGRQMVIRGIDRLFLWAVPGGTGPLSVRIAAYTNARISRDGRLVWPWE